MIVNGLADRFEPSLFWPVNTYTNNFGEKKTDNKWQSLPSQQFNRDNTA